MPTATLMCQPTSHSRKFLEPSSGAWKKKNLRPILLLSLIADKQWERLNIFGTQLVRQNSEVLLVLGPCPHEPGHNYLIIETTYFLSGFVWTGPLNRPGERFQNNAVSVCGFTGFVRTEGRFVSYLYVVTQRSSPQTAFVWRSVAWRLKERLCSRLTRTRNYWNTSFSHNLSLCYFIYSLCAVV